jgi:hypothetical protein
MPRFVAKFVILTEQSGSGRHGGGRTKPKVFMLEMVFPISKSIKQLK